MFFVNSSWYEQWKKDELTLEEFAAYETGFIRCVTESALVDALKRNERRSKEEIDQLVTRFWKIFNEQIKREPDRFNSIEYHTHLILKKL